MGSIQNALDKILELFPGIEQEAGLGLGEGGSQVPWCTTGLHVLIILLQVVPPTNQVVQHSNCYVNM